MADGKKPRSDRRERRRPASAGRRESKIETANGASEPAGTSGARARAETLAAFFHRFPGAQDHLPVASVEAYRRAQGSRRGRLQLASDQAEFLWFDLSDQHFALELTDVEAVLKVPRIVEVPRAPEYLLGVATLRGSVVPVFDLRRRLGLPAPAPVRESRLVLAFRGEEKNALLVDRVRGVMRTRTSEVEQPPHLDGPVGAAARGLVRRNGRIVVLLEVEPLVAVDDG